MIRIFRRALALRLLAVALLSLLLFNGGFYLQQPHITFYPQAELVETPAQWGLPYEEVVLTTADRLKLYGWFIPAAGASKTLLFFHGNGGNISHREASLAIFHRLGLNVLIIDYRGYGRSEGEADEVGLYRDAQAAWDYLTQQRAIAAQNIILFGRSLGGAVATDLASKVKPAALILESTFSSAAEMAEHLFPRISRVVWLRYRFDSAQKIARLRTPLLLLHSPQDEVIPFRLGRKLFDLAAQPKQFFALRGGHNDGFLRSQPAYERALRGFIGTL